MGSTATSETGATWVPLSPYEPSDGLSIDNPNSDLIEYRRVDAQGGAGVIGGGGRVSFDGIRNLNQVEIRRYDQGDAPITVEWTNTYYGLAELTASASIDFASMLTATEDTKTITVPGATTTNNAPVYVGWAATLEPGIVVAQAWVSAADTVSIRVRNVSAGTIDPAAVVCRVMVARI